MTVYALSHMSIDDLDQHDLLWSRIVKVISRFDGELLCADSNPTVIEGDWNNNSVILLSFPDERTFREWSQSAEYQKFANGDLVGAKRVTLLANGYEAPPLNEPAKPASFISRYLEAHEVLMISFFAISFTLLGLLLLYSVQSQGNSLQAAFQEYDWIAAILLTSLVFVAGQIIDDRKNRK